MRQRVLILGATGMLGSVVYDVLKDAYDLVLTARDPRKFSLIDRRYGGISAHAFVRLDVRAIWQDYREGKGDVSEHWRGFLGQVGTVDYVINAIGITIPFARDDPALTFFINSALPHLLARTFRERLIHITTDCVFDGHTGFPYDERSPHTPVDLYGISKSLGEPTSCLTIRTSIIGRELENGHNFLEWFLQQEGKSITGYANHFWNGITTKQFGKICDRIMRQPERFPQAGLFHAFSATVSKYDMLVKFKEKYRLNCTIQKDETKHLNRTLASVHDFNAKLQIPSFEEMLTEL